MFNYSVQLAVELPSLDGQEFIYRNILLTFTVERIK